MIWERKRVLIDKRYMLRDDEKPEGKTTFMGGNRKYDSAHKMGKLVLKIETVKKRERAREREREREMPCTLLHRIIPRALDKSSLSHSTSKSSLSN